MANEGGGDEDKAKKPKKEDDAPRVKKKKPEEHVNHERWLVSYADFITLLFAFFTVLYALSQADKAKMQAAETSIRKAFEGPKVFRSGVNGLGTLESDSPMKPYPIDFKTAEGLLDKHEVNRNSAEDLVEMEKVLSENELSDSVDMYEMTEGVQVKVKDKIYFQKDSLKIEDISIEVFDKILKTLKDNHWTIIVEGHSSLDEGEGEGEMDSMMLSTLRAHHVAKSLLTRGVRDDQVVPISYGNTRPDFPSDNEKNRRVEFILRRVDPRQLGRKIY